jgi:hypothetical protein
MARSSRPSRASNRRGKPLLICTRNDFARAILIQTGRSSTSTRASRRFLCLRFRITPSSSAWPCAASVPRPDCAGATENPQAGRLEPTFCVMESTYSDNPEWTAVWDHNRQPMTSRSSFSWLRMALGRAILAPQVRRRALPRASGAFFPRIGQTCRADLMASGAVWVRRSQLGLRRLSGRAAAASAGVPVPVAPTARRGGSACVSCGHILSRTQGSEVCRGDRLAVHQQPCARCQIIARI